jgi:molecular chaperone GrpE
MVKQEDEKARQMNGVDGRAASQGDTEQMMSVDEAAPRVVDKRRFLRLLDSEVESGSLAEPTPRFPSFVEELQTRLKLSEDRMAAVEQAYREARSNMEHEVDAVRQRLNRALDERVEQSRAQFVRNLLAVLDHLRRAVRSAEETTNMQALVEGVQAIVSMFERALQSEGVSEVRALNQPFDPRWHEVVDVVEVGPEQDGIVIEVIEPGYQLGEKTLIRPARVRVGQSKAGTPANLTPTD